MGAKLKQRKKAENLRREGLSYTEIQQEIHVSKSSLSLWLRDIKLTRLQIKRLKEKSVANQHLGAKANKQIRKERAKKIINQAKNEIGEITSEELHHLGAMLYWGEGAKQKPHNPSERVSFNNSDPLMIRMFLKWLLESVKVNTKAIDFSIYSHENIRERENDVVKYWSKITNFPKSSFRKIYYKKDKKNKYRKNQGKSYHGLLRVTVLKSTDLNRKILGWIEGICKQCGVV